MGSVITTHKCKLCLCLLACYRDETDVVNVGLRKHCPEGLRRRLFHCACLHATGGEKHKLQNYFSSALFSNGFLNFEYFSKIKSPLLTYIPVNYDWSRQCQAILRNIPPGPRAVSRQLWRRKCLDLTRWFRLSVAEGGVGGKLSH